ncbi:LysR family transcriptional regulator [Alcaligenaceae bacterium]|nr:LysR family transcriptional regulator [Alcaligenaceae bacterium]
MRLQDLNIFLHVIEHGSQHRAAEVLELTQSTVSKALVRLEQDVGMQLFDRNSRGLDTTEAGRTLIRHAKKVLLAVNDLENELEDQGLARAGSVRLGSLPYLVPSLISPLLATFFVNRPLATFSIETHLSARLIALLQNGEVDLSMAATPKDPPPDLESLPLGPLTLQIVARADHPRLHLFTNMANLAQERWAMPAASLYLRQWLEERFTLIGLPAPRLAVESTASPVVFAELLRRSDLLSIMPPRVVQHAEGRGLVAIQGTGMSWDQELSIFWRKDSYLSPICRDFRDAVIRYCSETGI